MNNHIDKKFFISSLLIHVFFILIFLFFNADNKIHKKFLVLGRYSKKPTHAYFNRSQATNKSDWLGMRKQEMQKVAQAKKDAQLKRQAAARARTRALAQKKAAQARPAPKIPIKKPTPKPTQTKTPAKPEPKKPVIKEPPKPKVVPNKEEIKKPEPIQEPITTETANEQNEQKEEELHFNLMGESDPNLAVYQNHIQKEVERVWRPPVGIPKGTECSLCFIVNSNGEVENFDFIERSNILIYDLSVSRVAKRFKFDRCLWNKKFTIDFRQ